SDTWAWRCTASVSRLRLRSRSFTPAQVMTRSATTIPVMVAVVAPAPLDGVLGACAQADDDSAGTNMRPRARTISVSPNANDHLMVLPPHLGSPLSRRS